MGNVFIVGERKNPELPEPEISKEDLDRIIANVSKYTASRNVKPITNFDRIKQMDEEDLAGEFFNWFCNGYDEYYISDMSLYYDVILSWLREPIQED